MKKSIILVIFLAFFPVIAFAGEVGVIWRGEGVHGTFELLLSEHEGKVLGSLVAGAGNPRKWVSYPVTQGVKVNNKISLIIITDGCDGGEGSGKVLVEGVIEGEVLKASLATLCAKKEEILFRKE